MRGRPWFAVLLIVACGPTVATDDGSGSGDASGTAGDADGSTATTVPSADTSAGQGGDACVSGDPAACPEDCYPGFALQVIDDACTTSSVEVCLPSGPKPGGPTTTYWALAPSGPVFAEYGGDCSVAALPEVWHECSGAAGEPADCACFCYAGYCPGDEDRRALDECGLDSPCDPLYVDAQFGAANHDAEHCILEALGVRTPGVYDIAVASGTAIAITRFYVFGDDVVERIEQVGDDVTTCPQTSDWGRASRCTLASGAFFAACLEPQPEGEDCVLDLESWVSDCSEEAPTCG